MASKCLGLSKFTFTPCGCRIVCPPGRKTPAAKGQSIRAATPCTLVWRAGENSTIWDAASPKFIFDGSEKEEKFDHPTQKPMDVMRKPIFNHTLPGEAIYDCFLGSGTTLLAAEQTGRVCYGVELDPKYIDVIVRRWQLYTGKQAVLDGDGRSFEEIAEQRGAAA